MYAIIDLGVTFHFGWRDDEFELTTELSKILAMVDGQMVCATAKALLAMTWLRGKMTGFGHYTANFVNLCW